MTILNLEYFQRAPLFFYLDGQKIALQQDPKLFGPREDIIVVKGHSPINTVFALWKMISQQRPLFILDPHETDSLSLQRLQTLPLREDLPPNCLLITSTSGSSGEPKLVCHSFFSLTQQLQAQEDFFHLPQNLEWYAPLPLNHLGGIMSLLRAWASHGVFSTSQNWKSFLPSKIQFASLVSSQLDYMIDHEKFLPLLKNAQGILLGGSRATERTILKAWRENIPLSLSYGMTETAGAIVATNFFQKKMGPMPLPRAFGPHQVQLDHQNCLAITSPALALGHFQNGDFVPYNAQLHTTDLAQIQPSGEVIILGRKDDIFISGGENISPKIIESHLLLLPFVQAAYVVAKDHQVFGEVPLAIVKLTSDYCMQRATTELQAHCLPLAPALRPKHFHFLPDDDLPPGKIKISSIDLRNFARSLPALDRGIDFFSHGPLVYEQKLVALHGFLGEAWDWIFLARAKKYLLVCPHLYFAKKWPANWNEAIDEICAFLSPLQSFSLLGYSMGGRIALGIYFHSSLAHTLIIESSHSGLSQETEKEERRAADSQLLANIHSQEKLQIFLKNWYAMPLFRGIERARDYPLLLSKKLANIRSYQKAITLFSLGEMPCFDKSLSQTFIHYICGKEDDKYFHIGKKLQEQGHALHAFENCSHNVHLQNEEQYFELIVSLIADREEESSDKNE